MQIHFLCMLALSCVPIAGALSSGAAARAESVDEGEAVAVAKFWLTREFNRRQSEPLVAPLREPLPQLDEHALHYLTASGEWRSERPAGTRILGYVVHFRSGAFVALSSDDRLEPVLAFDSRSAFPIHAQDHFLHSALRTALVNRWRLLAAELQAGGAPSEHPRWAQLRLEIEQPESAPQALSGNAIHIEWSTPAWNQPFPYNAVCAAQNGNQDVPTGCVATAIAIKLGFHRWPNTGFSAHAYDDDQGLVQGHHFVDYSAANYDWSSMPTTDIVTPNADIAELMYHCGVAVDMNYELDESGAWPSIAILDHVFRYWGSLTIVNNHEPQLAASVIAGLPVLALTTTHMVVVDGYRNDSQEWFHVNAGWGGWGNAWLALNQLPGGDPLIYKSYPFQSPTNQRYVDVAWQGAETGHVLSPYDTLAEGLAQTPTGGALWIKSATFTSAPSVLDRAMTLHSYSGSTILDR